MTFMAKKWRGYGPQAFPRMTGYDDPREPTGSAAVWKAGQEWGRRRPAGKLYDVAADVAAALDLIAGSYEFFRYLPERWRQ